MAYILAIVCKALLTRSEKFSIVTRSLSDICGIRVKMLVCVEFNHLLHIMDKNSIK